MAGVGYYLWRNDPALVTARDDSLRDELVDGAVPFTRRDGASRLKLAIWHCSGLKWTNMLKAHPATFESDLRKLAWTLSGADVFGERFPGNSEHDVQMRLEQGRGTVLGPLGLGLVVLGLLSLRERRGWVLLGLVIAAGNLAFYFFYHTFDNLDFISPAITGLALVSGLGADWLTSRRHWGGIPEVLALAAPLMLLAANYQALDQSGPRQQEILRTEYELAHVRLPRDAVVLTSFKSASMYRYLFWVHARRTDVHVVIFHGGHSPQQIARLSEKLWKRFGAVYVPAINIPPDVRTLLASRTPPEIRQYGLVVNTAK